MSYIPQVLAACALGTAILGVSWLATATFARVPQRDDSDTMLPVIVDMRDAMRQRSLDETGGVELGVDPF